MSRRNDISDDRNERKICHIYRLGTIEYQKAWELQCRIAKLIARNQASDTLLLLEHPPTYTLGRKTDERHFFVPPDWIKEGKVEVRCVDRGGDVTFHGPGQLVGYPIIRLSGGFKETIRYLRNLEEMLIRTLKSFDIRSERLRGYTGVWVQGSKAAAMGIKVDVHGVTLHGFALNVNTDLSYFTKIVPCGIREKGVTSLAQILGRSVPMEQVMDEVIKAFEEVFDKKMTEKDPAVLEKL